MQAYAAAGKLLHDMIAAGLVDVTISELWQKPEPLSAGGSFTVPIFDRHEWQYMGYWELGKIALRSKYPNDFTTYPISAPRPGRYPGTWVSRA